MSPGLLPSASFPSTSWTLVADAVRPGRPALGELVQRYLPALRRFLQLRCRIRESEVDDILADFIARKIVERDLLSTARPDRGRLRSLLIASLRNHLTDLQRARTTRTTAEMSAARPECPPITSRDAICAFDAEWARATLDEALSRFRSHLTATGRAHIWELFELRVLAPARDEAPAIPYEQLVERFGFQTATQACSAVTTAKRGFARTLREIIAETCEDAALVDDELAHLRQILASDPTRDGFPGDELGSSSIPDA